VSIFGKPVAVGRAGRYDRVVFTGANGMPRELTGAEFDDLPLGERAKILLTGNPRFSLNGQAVTVRSAIVQE
jgi:hypothetical protein